MAYDIVPLQDAPDALVQGASTHMLSPTQLLVHKDSPAVGSPALEAIMIDAGEGVGQDVRLEGFTSWGFLKAKGR
jgi:hypothetical protein